MSGWACGLAAGVSALLAGTAGAQPPQQQGMPAPRIFAVSPAGGKAGTTFEVSVAGTDLDEPLELSFGLPGARAEAIEAPKPKGDAKPAAETLRQPGGNAVPVQRRHFRVTIPAEAPIGIHDVRVVNDSGVSNPRAFAVGDLEEAPEGEPNNDVTEARRVALGTTIDGGIATPTDVDDFVFAGERGQRVVASLLTTSLDSRLLGAVEIYDSGGKRLAAGREYQGGDALADATLPADGDYLVRVHDFTYTSGGLDHFYRLMLTTAPWIDAVFPPAVEPGRSNHLVVFGRNLPGGRPDPAAVAEGRVLDRAEVTLDAGADLLARLAFGGLVAPASSGLDGLEFRLRNASGASNPALLTIADAPLTLDRGDNDDPAHAQEVEPPCEIAGKVEARGDRDWYAFAAKKGEVLAIEAIGDRLGSPLDLYLALRDEATGKVLVEVDDGPPVAPASQFFTRTDDPAAYRFVAPADGRYRLMVASREAASQAGPRHVYRVRIAPERPDFRLVVMPRDRNAPADGVVGRGGRLDFAVHAWRKDGWDGPIRLTAEGLPPGVSCPPQSLGTGQNQGPLVVEADYDAPDWVGPIVVKGTAAIGGMEVVREARTASVTWQVPPQQQNIPAVSRLDRALMLAVRREAPFRLAGKVAEVAAVQGEKAKVPLAIERAFPTGKLAVQVTAPDLPAAAFSAFAPMAVAAEKGEAEASLTIRPDAPPGLYAVAFRGLAQVPVRKPDKDAKGTKMDGPRVAVSQPSTPVLVTVLPKQLAKLSVQSGVKVKPGESAEVLVKVARQFGFNGPFRVELIAGPEAKDVEADEVTIPAGQDEAKLTLRVAADADLGRRLATARVTALFLDKTPIVQEAKFTAAVLK